MRRNRILIWLALACLSVGTLLTAPSASAGTSVGPVSIGATINPPASSSAIVGTALANGRDKEEPSACENYASVTGAYKDVCIYNDLHHGRYGRISYSEMHGESAWVDGVVGIERCQAINNTPQNCSDFNFTSGSESVRPYGYFAVTTEPVTANFGWIFRACGNMDDHRAAHGDDELCSPWMTGDPKQ